MRHGILTILLSFGVVGGLAYGIIEHRHKDPERHSRFKEHVADICVAAALRTLDGKGVQAETR